MSIKDSLFRSFRINPQSKLSQLGVILVVYVVLQLSLIGIVGNSLFLAPDEARYLWIFENLYRANFGQDQLLYGWSDMPIGVLKVIYLIPKILMEIGLSPLLSLRMNSVLLSCLNLILIWKSIELSRNKFKSKALTLLPIFLPSFIIWSTLGLREIYLFVSLSGMLYGICLALFRQRVIQSAIIVLIFSALLLFTKSYLWLLFTVSYLATIVVIRLFGGSFLRDATKLTGALLAPFILATLIGGNSLSHLNFSAVFQLGLREDNAHEFLVEPTPTKAEPTPTKAEPTPTKAEPTPTKLEVIKTQGVTSFELNRNSQKSLILNWAVGVLGLDQAKYADVTDLEFPTAQISEPLSFFRAIIYFLAAPLPFNNQTTVMRITGFESLLWICLYLFIAIMLIRRDSFRNLLTFPHILMINFILIFTIASCMVEINIGTAFRHRSLLVTPLAFVISALLSRTRPNLSHFLKH